MKSLDDQEKLGIERKDCYSNWKLRKKGGGDQEKGDNLGKREI
jgi:hypothetical protein